MRRAFIAAVLGFVASTGCSESHAGTIAGIPTATRLGDFTDDEWSRFCEWAETAGGAGAPAVYTCMGDDVVAGACAAPGRTCYDWTYETCLSAPGGTRDYWTRTPPCNPTLRAEADCRASLFALGVCFREHFPPTGSTPECDSICRDVAADAGPSPDGG